MSRSERHSKKLKSKKISKTKIILLTILFILLLSIGIGGVYSYKLLNKIDKVDLDSKDMGIASEVEDKLSEYNDSIENIALYGVDAVDGEFGRSDSIMVLTVDNKNKKIKVTSIMRDSYVDIENHGKDKLNHAYAFGGPQLAVKTLNQNFDLNVKNFVTVNFSSLPKVIDQVGGIDLNITGDELKFINNYINDLNTKNNTNISTISSTGNQHVDGTQAVAYSRIRYTNGGDYERTERQRTVLEALFQKFKSTSATEYPKLLNELLPLVKTNLNTSEILALASTVAKIGPSNLQQERFPLDANSKGSTINKIYYLQFDKEPTVKQMHDYIFEDKKPENN